MEPIKWIKELCDLCPTVAGQVLHIIFFLMTGETQFPNEQVQLKAIVLKKFEDTEISDPLLLLQECLWIMRRSDLLKNVGGFNVVQKRQVPKCKEFLCRVARSLADNHKQSLAEWICDGFEDSEESENEKTLFPLEMLLSAFLRHSRMIASEGLYISEYKTASEDTCSQVIKFVENNYKSEYKKSFSKARRICKKFKNCFKPVLAEPDQQFVNVRAQITELTRDIDLDKMEKDPEHLMIEAEVFQFISRTVCRGATELACIQPTVFYNHMKTDKEAVNAYLQMHIHSIHPDWKILYIPYLYRCPDDHKPFHWVLFVADRSEHQVFFYDTLRKKCNEKMRNDISRILDELRDDDIPWNDPITVVDCVTQLDNTSCGYWVCYLAWGHALGTLHEVYKLTSEQVRQEVILKLSELKNENNVPSLSQGVAEFTPYTAGDWCAAYPGDTTNADGQIELIAISDMPPCMPVTPQASKKGKHD